MYDENWRAGNVQWEPGYYPPTIDNEAWTMEAWTPSLRTPQWGARYQDTGMQFLKLYFPNISFSGAARRWSKGVVVPRKSRQFNRAYLKAAYQIAQCSLGCDLNLVYELTIFQIPRVSDLFGNQQLTSTGRHWILCPTENTGWIIQSEQINCYVQKLVIVNKG